jgi:hypothetical protein
MQYRKKLLYKMWNLINFSNFYSWVKIAFKDKIQKNLISYFNCFDDIW